MTVKDPTGLTWFVCHRISMLLGKKLTEIMSKNKKTKIMAREMDIAPTTTSCIIKQDLGLGAFIQQTGQCLIVALRKIWGKNQDACC
jgi:hypothetical protein